MGATGSPRGAGGPTPLQCFSANLVRARRRAGLSQRELAERCGLHPTEVSVLERQGREPRLGMLLRLSAALGISAGELCAGIV